MGITNKDRVEQFKRDCKSVSYYNKVICYCDEQIRLYDEILTQVGEQKQDESINPKAILLEQEKLMAEKTKKEEWLQEIYERINQIADNIDRQMVIDAFIKGLYYKKLVNEYHFNDSSALYRHINRIIDKIV